MQVHVITIKHLYSKRIHTTVHSFSTFSSTNINVKSIILKNPLTFANTITVVYRYMYHNTNLKMVFLHIRTHACKPQYKNALHVHIYKFWVQFMRLGFYLSRLYIFLAKPWNTDFGRLPLWFSIRVNSSV